MNAHAQAATQYRRTLAATFAAEVREVLPRFALALSGLRFTLVEDRAPVAHTGLDLTALLALAPEAVRAVRALDPTMGRATSSVTLAAVAPWFQGSNLTITATRI